jgi:ribose transport system substrate-binding protein
MQQLFRRASALAAGAAVTLALAACGDGSEEASSASGVPSANPEIVAAAQANLTKYLAPPTSIVQSTALTSVPPKKKVAFVQCADPSCATLATYVKDATGTLGWDLITVNATATDPGAAIQQAIDAGVDYIATTGFPVALFKQQMAQAKAKGIPIFMCYSTDVPGGPTNNLYSDCYDSTAANAYGKSMADFLIVHSQGTANVLVVTIPTYPILTAQVDAMRAELNSSCGGCKLSTLETTVNDLAGGAVPQNVSSYLQAHPDVRYVFFTYNGLETAVPTALRSAGLLSNVKLVGTQGLQAQMKEIVDGTSLAWTALPQELSMWTMVDQMARLSVNQWSLADERKAAVPPFYLVTTEQDAKAIVDLKDGWPGPSGFKDTFRKLWGV